MMTKKDYKLIAEVLHNSSTCSLMGSGDKFAGKEAIQVVVRHIRHDLGEALQADNPRFDTEKWYKAVGV